VDFNDKNLDEIAEKAGTKRRTAQLWLHQRKELGSPAYRRPRKKSEILGRTSKVTKDICKTLVHPSNLVRDQRYESQIEHFDISIKERQLQRKLKDYGSPIWWKLLRSGVLAASMERVRTSVRG